MDDCLFCKIAKKDLESDLVHEDDDVVAFRDIDPQAPTHILVIPKEHVESARALKDRHGDVLAQIFQVAEHLARAEGIDRRGYRLVTNVGSDGGQEVHHLHFHLLGGRQMTWPPG